MHWNELTSLNQLYDIINLSKEQSYENKTVLFFKHSTRCSISSMALNRFNSKWEDNESVSAYYLDLLAHRDISNEIAATFNVEHASPQVLLINKGVCYYHNSHNGIMVSEIKEAIAKQIQ